MIDDDARAGLQATRDVAGTRYRKAVEELHAAFVGLAAIDRQLSNDHFRTADHVRTFGANADDWKLGLQHPDYAPTIGGCWSDEITARANQLMIAP